MYRKWKSVAALGMAVLIGCSMPMGTMLAAEENPEAVQEVEVDSASDTDAAYDDETVLDDNGNGGEEINADDEIAVEEVDADDEIADEEVIADNDGNAGIAVMSVADTEAGDVAVQEDTAAPVIDIKFQGQSSVYDLGGNIDYKYVNNKDQAFVCSVSQVVSYSYCLEKVSSTTSDAKGEGQMNSLSWTETSSSSERIVLSEDASYVLYVKAEANGQTVYARSGGVVVDTIKPVFSPLIEGKTYAEGTAFWVSDANLESVMVNETLVTPESDKSYRVRANGTSTSCVIRAIDKAGNQNTCNITVSRGPAEDNVISASGLYSLKKGVAYKLAAGNWQVGGDKSVYSGGNTFYVNEDGNFKFTKR